MKEIKLTKGMTTAVDDEDFEIVSKHEWYAHKSKNRWYGRAEINGKKIYLHRFLMNVSNPNIKIDHKDGNSLNNVKSNLRMASQRENSRHKAGLYETNTSGYRGIVFHKNSKRIKRWQGKIWIEKDGTPTGKSLGYFHTAEEAARAFDQAAIAIYGEFCGQLNFK